MSTRRIKSDEGPRETAAVQRLRRESDIRRTVSDTEVPRRASPPAARRSSARELRLSELSAPDIAADLHAIENRLKGLSDRRRNDFRAAVAPAQAAALGAELRSPGVAAASPLGGAANRAGSPSRRTAQRRTTSVAPAPRRAASVSPRRATRAYDDFVVPARVTRAQSQRRESVRRNNEEPLLPSERPTARTTAARTTAARPVTAAKARSDRRTQLKESERAKNRSPSVKDRLIAGAKTGARALYRAVSPKAKVTTSGEALSPKERTAAVRRSERRELLKESERAKDRSPSVKDRLLAGARTGARALYRAVSPKAKVTTSGEAASPKERTKAVRKSERRSNRSLDDLPAPPTTPILPLSPARPQGLPRVPVSPPTSPPRPQLPSPQEGIDRLARAVRPEPVTRRTSSPSPVPEVRRTSSPRVTSNRRATDAAMIPPAPIRRAGGAVRPPTFEVRRTGSPVVAARAASPSSRAVTTRVFSPPRLSRQDLSNQRMITTVRNSAARAERTNSPEDVRAFFQLICSMAEVCRR